MFNAPELLRSIEASLGPNPTPQTFIACLETTVSTLKVMTGQGQQLIRGQAGTSRTATGRTTSARTTSARTTGTRAKATSTRSTQSGSQATRGRQSTMKPGSVGFTVLKTITENPNFTTAELVAKTQLAANKVGSVLGNTRSSLPNNEYVTANGQGGWNATAKGFALIQQHEQDQTAQQRRAA